MPIAVNQHIDPIVGSTAALIASIQVTETIKYFTKIGEAMAGQMLIYSGQTMEFEKIDLSYRPGCSGCGGRKT
jgi:molybdopterin/thiamine biosynthesis adenylyltransferase